MPVDFVLPISFAKGLTADIGESKAHASELTAKNLKMFRIKVFPIPDEAVCRKEPPRSGEMFIGLDEEIRCPSDDDHGSMNI